MSSKNLMVKALAGVGKSTTMLWSVGSVPRGIKLSDEQEAIRKWIQDQKIKKFRFLAFNKAIATELADKIPAYCEAATCHSSGLSIIKMNHGRGIKVDTWKYRKIMDKLLGEPRKPADYSLRNAVNTVIDLARVNMLGFNNDGRLELSMQDIEYLINAYDVEGDAAPSTLLDVANKSLVSGSVDFKTVDFTDMIWLPVFHQMKASTVDGLIVDECQDLSRCQQELVMMQGNQIICVGDINQAIYGFAGADADSMNHLENTLQENGGVDVLPLTMTRRCGKKIVEMARKIVPSYRAADTNPDGDVRYIEEAELVDELRKVAGNGKSTMVLCRTNAPLVSLAFKLLKEEIRVVIRGRDIGQGLIKLVNKMAGKSDSVDKMLASLDVWATKEETAILRRYKYGADAKIVTLQDKVDCIRVLCGDCNSVTDLTNKLNRLFQDGGDTRGVIVLSSVHKAKGLEADYIYVYKPALLPHPRLVEKANGNQEFHLQYIAYTRAIEVLVIVVENRQE